MANSTIKKFLDAGVQFTEMSRKQAEGLVKSLVKSGELQRKDAEKVVGQLLERGRETTERVAQLVQAEVSKQVSAFSERFDEVEDRVEALAEMLEARVKRSAKPSAPAEPAAAPVVKAPAKKAAAKKAASKTAAKKTAARKTAAKKAPSKQAAVLAPALGLSEDEVEAITDDGPVTPSGIPAAGEGINPDTTETDLHQPGTEPLMDPATVKAAVSESEMMRRAADPDKG